MRKLQRDFRLMPLSGIAWKKVNKFLVCERGVITIELVAIALVLAIGAIAVTGMIMEGLATPACGVVQQLDANADCGN